MVFGLEKANTQKTHKVNDYKLVMYPAHNKY